MKRLPLNQINYAIKDIQNTLKIWRDHKEWNDNNVGQYFMEEA